jgi:hypothetical protein
MVAYKMLFKKCMEVIKLYIKNKFTEKLFHGNLKSFLKNFGYKSLVVIIPCN